MRGATQARQGMTLCISILMYPPNLHLMTGSGAPLPPPALPFFFNVIPFGLRTMSHGTTRHAF
jgi:hypothetical protein